MKRRNSSMVTPLEVVQPRNLAFFGVRASSMIGSVSAVSWWLLGAVVAGVMMVSLGAGTLPKSFAQDTVKDMPTMDDWDNLAQCESGGDWSIDSGNGYSGGIQFNQQTWKANGGKTENAKDATKEEQIAVAEKVWKERGWQPWPDCSSKVDFSIDKPTDASTGSVVAAGSQDKESGDDAADTADGSDDASDDSSTSDGGSDDIGSVSARDRSENDPGALEDQESSLSKEQIISEDLGDPRFASPMQYAAAVPSVRYESITSAISYLPTARWQDANLLSLAPVNGMGDLKSNGLDNMMTYVSQVLFKISQSFFYYIELLLLYTLSADILTKGSYLANQAFFLTGQKVAAIQDDGNGNYSFSMPYLLVLAIGAAILLAAVMYAGPVSITGPYRRRFTTVALISVVSSGVLILLVVRAGQDVASKDGGYGNSIASQTLADAPLLQFANNSDAVKEAEKASNWTVGSPGWVVATLTTIANDLSSFLAGLTYLITNTINKTAMREQTQCQIYSNALYAVFASTAAAQNMGDGRTNTVISYDRMIQSLFQQNYAAGAMADTSGSQSAWCRMAEVDTNRPTGEQAMISRVAGLNREAVGTGGLGLITNASGNVRKDGYVANINSINVPNRGGAELQVTGGEFVEADGQWKALEQTEKEVATSGDETQTVQRAAFEGAASYFGPSYPANNPNAAKLQATYYWAACQWGKTNEDGSYDNTGTYHAGRGASLNPEWKNVIRAKGDDNKVLTVDDCTNVISAKVGQGFGESWTDGNVNDVESAHFEFSITSNESARVDDPSSDEGDGGCSGFAPGCWVSSAAGAAKDAAGKAINTVTGGAAGTLANAGDTAKEIVEWFQASTPTPKDAYGSNFQSAQSVNGGNNALDYAMRVSGKNSTSAMVAALVSLVIAYMIVRTVGGLILGGLLATIMALIALIFAVIFLIALIVPLPFIQRGAKAAGKTVLSAFLVDGFMILVFAALFSMNELLRTIILPITQNVVSSAVIGSVIACLTFYGFGKLTKYFSKDNIDLNSFRGAVSLMPLAAAPMINGFGGKTDTVLDKARGAASKVPGRGKKTSNAKTSTGRPTDAQRREAERRQIQDQFNDDRRKRHARAAETDEAKRRQRQMRRDNKQRRRAVADTAAATAAATGYGAGAAGAHRVGSRIWRPISDGVTAAKDKTADGFRTVGRKLQDGQAYAAYQSKMALMDDGSDIDRRSAEAADAMTPNAMATTTDEQRLRTGLVYPNEDNVEAFDSKIPGSMSDMRGPATDAQVANSVAAHEAAMTAQSTTSQRPPIETAGQMAALQSAGLGGNPVPSRPVADDANKAAQYEQQRRAQEAENIARSTEYERRTGKPASRPADMAQMQSALRSNPEVRGFAKSFVNASFNTLSSNSSSTRDALRQAKMNNDSRGLTGVLGMFAARQIEGRAKRDGNSQR